MVFTEKIARLYLYNFYVHKIYILRLHIFDEFNLTIIFIHFPYIPIRLL